MQFSSTFIDYFLSLRIFTQNNLKSYIEQKHVYLMKNVLIAAILPALNVNRHSLSSSILGCKPNNRIDHFICVTFPKAFFYWHRCTRLESYGDNKSFPCLISNFLVQLAFFFD